MSQPKLLDTVALLKDLPSERLTLVEPELTAVDHLPSGLVGTIVHVYERDNNEYYLVEFADAQGREYAMAILLGNEVLALHHELATASQLTH